jgi:hypothetical protein
MGVYRLLYLLRSRPDHSSLPSRTLIVADGEVDWNGRPKPPEPLKEIALYEYLNDYFKEQSIRDCYDRLWPKITMKIFNRCVNRGYIEERGGVYHLTNEGENFAMRVYRDKMGFSPYRYQRYSHALTPYRQQQKKRLESASEYLSEWNRDEYGVASLPRFIRSFGLSQSTKRKLLHHYMSERRVEPPPPRVGGRRKGWGGRIRQHEVDRKEKRSWE